MFVFCKVYANHHTQISNSLIHNIHFIDRLLFQNSEMKVVWVMAWMVAWMMAQQTQTQMMKVRNTIITS